MSHQDPYQPPSGAAWQPGPASAPPPYQQPAYQQPTYQQPAYPPAYGGEAPGHPSFAAYGTPEPQYGYPTAPQYAAPGYGYGYAPIPYGAAPTYAHWGLRVGALLLDLLGLIPYWIGAFVSGFSSTAGYDAYGQPTSVPTSTGTAVLVVGALVSLGLWVWNRGVQQARTGQSWGKKVVGLRLVREETGENVGVGRALLRDITHWLDCWLLGLGFWFPLWDAKRQTFADKIVKTVSVK